MRGVPVISIAEAVGDPRVKKARCYVCKQTKLISKRRGSKFTCVECAEPLRQQRRAARCILTMAIKAGFIRSHHGQQCVDCGAPAIGLEHREYSRPLDVEPICNSCNFRRGPAKLLRANDPPLSASVATTDTPAPLRHSLSDVGHRLYSGPNPLGGGDACP
jgi:hypothetical protein